MKIRLIRYGFGRNSTLGILSIDGEHVGFSIEDERRNLKVPGETCIPIGEYEVKLNPDSPKFAHYYQKYPKLHRGMLWLQNVPKFEMVYIHPGNSEDHTDGCILPNVKPVALPDGEFRGEDSATAYLAIYKKVIAALDKGERVTIEIIERTPA